MGYSQKSIREMYNRVLDALPGEFADLPADSDATAAAAGLREQYAIIVEESGAQGEFEGSSQEGTAQRAVARKNIREYLSTLARTGRSIARKRPGFDEHFPPPSGKNDVQLLDDARVVAVKAVDNSAEFIRRGLTLQYLESINGFIRSFDSSETATNSANAAGGAAVGGKNAAYEQADEYFEILDDFIHNFYRERPDKLAAWKLVSHIRRSPGKNGVGEPGTEG